MLGRRLALRGTRLCCMHWGFRGRLAGDGGRMSWALDGMSVRYGRRSSRRFGLMRFRSGTR
jgi:hypothetical protein